MIRRAVLPISRQNLIRNWIVTQWLWK